MKTISMIGLINNVYNDFNIPERIKINYGYYEETFKWDKIEKWFVTLDDSTLLRIDQSKLNMEVEIIENNKKIEKIEIDSMNRIKAESTGNFVYNISQPMKTIIKKLNEVIDKLNSMEELK